jgi:hypothetical protein
MNDPEIPPMPNVKPRIPYVDESPDGYQESLTDWVDSNLEAVEWFCENADAIRQLINRKPIGEILPPDSMILRNHVGEASLGEIKYDMSFVATTGQPLIHNKNNRKWFTLSWEDILNLAHRAGINKSE